MGSVRSASTQRRVFLVALPAILVVVLAGAVLLDGRVPVATRQLVSSAGFLLAGLTGIAACLYRARQTTGRRRRSWRLFVAAGVTAIVSNVYSAAAGVDPVLQPNPIADAGLALAVLITIIGLVTFPSARRRGTDQLLMTLDGLVAGGGVLAITSVLVYPELLVSGVEDTVPQAIALAIPVLDSILVTVALVLLLRASGPDRWVLLLIASGFVSYAVADLAYAVLVAEQTFAFGSRLDLGWIAGYFVVSLAALFPSQVEDEPPPRASLADTRGAVIVFAVILSAGVVQVLFGDKLQGPIAFLWLLLVLAAGARQAILSRDNTSLRRGLERRVQEQTADLYRLARQNEVLLTSVGDGIYGVDLAGRITFVNPSAALALGLTTEEVLGTYAHHSFHADHDHETGDDCYINAAVRDGLVVAGIEDTYARAGGATFPVEVTAAPILDPDDDRPRGAVIVFRDVTQRREVERMKNEFLSVVSHELRTPLTSIRGSLGLLAGGAVGELEPRAATMVSVAVESSERLTRLINDLLDIERIGSGARAMRITANDSGTLVRAAVTQIEGMAAPQGVRLEVGPCEGAVLGDEDQVMQTLTNLLGNAIKFSEPGGRVVTTATVEGGHVLFRVIDEGRGIPADKLEEVFVPFAQVDSSDTRLKGGTGLGLAICRSIVERHGGRIWAESEYGQGTTVAFTLPAAPAAARVVDQRDREAS